MFNTELFFSVFNTLFDVQLIIQHNIFFKYSTFYWSVTKNTEGPGDDRPLFTMAADVQREDIDVESDLPRLCKTALEKAEYIILSK